MIPYVQDTDFTLYVGDVRQVLAELPAESVDCVVTSPPYWGLRDYGTDGQIGLEASPEEFVAEMVAVFRQVRRVLAPHGTCWINLGDSYANDTKWGGATGGKHVSALHGAAGGLGRDKRTTGLKSKDLVGIPWRVAFALQADGWYLRADIIWSKSNPMPESVTDRPTKAHEYVFLLSKQPRYFFDADAIREPAEWQRWGDQTNAKHEGSGSAASWIGAKPKVDLSGRPAPQEETLDGSEAKPIKGRSGVSVAGYEGRAKDGIARESFAMRGREFDPRGRNVRSVWEIATQPYPDAHFATFPEALPERCIKAGCPEFVCVTCGEPRVRIVETTYVPHGANAKSGGDYAGDRTSGDLTHGKFRPQEMKHGRATRVDTTSGWSDCGHGNYRPGVVLDPFIGSGTTALVARRHGRHTIGIELNPEYADLAARRLSQLSLLAEETA